MIYSRLIEQDSRLSLPGLDYDRVIITNISMVGSIDN